MDRRLAFLTAFLGFLGVALGALGAHAVKGAVLGLPDAVDRLAWWEVGARYHLFHAFAVGLVAVMSAHVTSRFPNLAAGLFTLGIILFSGSLYVMALTGVRTLGAVTPFGGIAFLAGWIALGLGARGLGRQKETPRPGEP
ncbi:MAG: DUF423 domain-containing protein [Archangium sp.]|nr:DUF423 domain-containing protein [Archangium sp.]